MSSPEGAFLAGLVAFLERKDDEAIRFFVRVLEGSAREKAITGRGVTSEGDVELGAKLTPLESAHIRALVFLHWTARRRGGYRGRSGGIPHDSEEAAMGGQEARRPRPLIATCKPSDCASRARSWTCLLDRGPLLEEPRRKGAPACGRDRRGALEAGGEGLSALFFDFDRDRDPDLLVTAHAPLALSLRRLVSPEGRANGGTPRLFENQGGRFVDVTPRVGLDRPFGVVDAEAFDVDSDGWTDLCLLAVLKRTN
jgi:hypothetical protein